jgi:hypothetical protein
MVLISVAITVERSRNLHLILSKCLTKFSTISNQTQHSFYPFSFSSTHSLSRSLSHTQKHRQRHKHTRCSSTWRNSILYDSKKGKEIRNVFLKIWKECWLLLVRHTKPKVYLKSLHNIKQFYILFYVCILHRKSIGIAQIIWNK